MAESLKPVGKIVVAEDCCPIFDQSLNWPSGSRCFLPVIQGRCHRHGNVSAAVEHYKKTAELVDVNSLKRE